MKIGKRIQALRIRKNMSGNQLAKTAGISQSTVCQLEMDAKSPTVHTLEKLCYALDVSLVEFFSDSDANLPHRHDELYRAIVALTPRQQGTLIRVVGHINEKRGRPKES